MNRRDTLKGMGLLIGGSMLSRSVLAEFIQTASAVRKGREWTPRIVPVERAALLPELVETIIPATDTPGAKDALVHIFVDLYVKDCYTKAQQEAFLKGLDSIDEESRKASNRPFLELSKDERLRLLSALEAQGPFIKMLKRLTLLGFYSSKSGATQAADYERSPGPFEGCIDLKPGQKADAMS
jgi:glucoside 3-dehydrogenase (cytochrome c) hitch-hiker subunit